MDRTSRIAIFGGALFLIAFELTLQRLYPTAPPRPVPIATVSAPVAGLSPAAPDHPNGGMAAIDSTLEKAAASSVTEQLSSLQNPAIRATFSSKDAGIREVELRQHLDGEKAHVVLNQNSQIDVLRLEGWALAPGAVFTPGPAAADQVSYETALAGGLKWRRTYALGSDYTISVRDELSNPGPTPLALPSYALSLGRAQPLRIAGVNDRNSNEQYLGAVWLTNTAFHLTTIGSFNPASYFGMVKTRDARGSFSSPEIDSAPLRWLGVENQFFTMLLTPQGKLAISSAKFLCLNERDDQGAILPRQAEPEIVAQAQFPALTVAPQATSSLNYLVYAGPKQFDRLNALGADQGELMNYGHFEPLIRPMLWVIQGVYYLVGNYGVAIICLTLLVKLITWPLQSFSSRSGKKMQALSPKIKELQAKYKEQPEKLNSETFALYRSYGVNPFGGCLPAIVQMPVFFSLYFMLQNLAELRGAHFLWVHDLTQPDTVATLHLLGLTLPINPLPLMVTGLTVVMLRMTPQIGDPQQAKIAQFMPLVFLFIFYNVAAGLSLYYVINNCVSILQIQQNLRRPLPVLVKKALPAPAR